MLTSSRYRITPELTKRLYGIPFALVATNASNSVSVAEFDGQFYKPSDLSLFSTIMGLPQPNVSVYGENYDTAGGESTLDIEWVTAVGTGVPATFFYVSQGFLLEWAMQMSNLTFRIFLLISISLSNLFSFITR